MYNTRKFGSTSDEQTSPVDKLDSFGQTPLHFAARSKCKDAVKLLLQCGADVNAVSARERTVLHELLLWPQKDKVRGDQLTQGETGDEEEIVEILRLLLAKQAPIQVCDCHGKTLLHIAARNRQKLVIKALLPHYGSGFLEKPDVWGNLALHNLLEAIKNESPGEDGEFVEVAALMIQKCPALLYLPDRYGRSPLHLAAENKQTEIMKMLLTFYKCRTA